MWPCILLCVKSPVKSILIAVLHKNSKNVLQITEINKRSVCSCLHLYLTCRIRDFIKWKYFKLFYFYHYYSILGRSEHYMNVDITRRLPVGRRIFSAKSYSKLSHTFLTSCQRRQRAKILISSYKISIGSSKPDSQIFALCWDLFKLPTMKRKTGTFPGRIKERQANWGMCR